MKAPPERGEGERMETGYRQNTVIQLAEMVHLFKSWGMGQREAIRLAIFLTFPHMFDGEECQRLVALFPDATPSLPDVKERRCGEDVKILGIPPQTPCR